MKTSNVITLIAVVVVALGALWYFSGPSQSAAPRSGAAAPAPGSAAAPASAHTITYDGTSFSPATLTVRVGDTVTFVDAGSDPMWIASAVHPVHSGYDGTTLAEHCAASYSGPAPFDECGASTASYSFTFTKAGTWPFHDHTDASAFGKVIVE